VYTKNILRIVRLFAIYLILAFQFFALNSQNQFTYFSRGLFEEDKAYIGNAVVEANEGYYVLGDVANSTTESDVVIHYLDDWGELQWTKILVPHEQYFESGVSLGGQLILSSDNNLVVAYTVADQGIFGHHNVVVRKIDFDGEDIWFFETDQENIDEELNPVIIEGHQGDFFVVYDYTKLEHGFDPQKIGLTKLNSNGEELWTKQILDDENIEIGFGARTVIAHSQGDYFIGGSYGKALLFQDMFIYKFDEDGTEIWRKGFDDGSLEGFAFITEMNNGNIWITAQKTIQNLNNPLIRNPLVCVIDSDGELLNIKSYDFVTESNITGQFGLRSTLAQIENNVYAVTPRTRLGEFALPWLWKVNAQADTVFTQTLVWNDSIYTEILDLEATSDGGLVAAGYTTPPIDTTTGELVMPQMAWLVKMDTLGNFCNTLGCDSTVLISSSALESILVNNELEMSISPNPASRERVQLYFNIPEELGQCKWHLFDMNGREKRSAYISQTGSREVALRHCAPGLYTWVLEYNGQLLERGKVLLE